MDKWLPPALAYIPSWLEFQLRMAEQPGCIIAVAHRDQILLEQAFGHADLDTNEKLTPRHRFPRGVAFQKLYRRWHHETIRTRSAPAG